MDDTELSQQNTDFTDNLYSDDALITDIDNGPDGNANDLIAGYDADTLPHFANEKNKQLHSNVKEKELRLVKVEEKINEQKARFKIMHEHMKNVNQELEHTRALCAIKKQEIDTEKHLNILASKEKHRLKSDSEKLNATVADHSNRINQIHNSIFNVNEKMDSFKLKMNWKQEELEQWTIAAKQKQDDKLALEKYKRADEAVIKKLNIDLEKASNNCERSKLRLDTEITETKAVQMQLDNAASEFRDLHSQRIELISRWDNAVKTIQEKDKNIINLSMSVQNHAIAQQEKDDEIKQQSALLENEKTESIELERQIDKMQRKLEKLRKSHTAQTKSVQEKSNDFMLLSSELNKIQNDARKISGDIETLEKMQQQYEKNLAKKQAHKKHMQEKLTSTINDVQIAKDSIQEFDSALEKNQSDLDRIIREKNDLKRLLFKKQQKIYTFKKDETSINNEISGTQASIKNLQSKINDLDKRASKQEETLYSLDFQIQQLERKVARASGKRTHEEQIELTNKISQLNVRLEDQSRHEKELTQQVKRFNDDLRAARTRSDQVVKDKARLENKISDCLLHNKSLDHEIESLNKQEIQVLLERDEQKLNVNNLKDQLKNTASKVYALENRKVQLQLTVEERMNEISQLKKMNTAVMRSKEQARHESQMELTQCESKVNKLKSKFVTLSGKIRGSSDGNSGDSDENEKSQVFYMIKIAQEREELQQKGDKLDTEIRKAEKDVKLLYKSLKHLNTGNQQYRTSLHSIELDEDFGTVKPHSKSKNDKVVKQVQYKNELESKAREINNTLYHSKQAMHDLKDHSKQLISQVNLLKSKINEISGEIDKYQMSTNRLNKKIDSQNEKLNRAKTNIAKTKTQLTSSLSDSSKNSLLQRISNEVELRTLRRKEKMVHDMLQHIVGQFPELQQSVISKMKENNIQLKFNGPTLSSLDSTSSNSQSLSCNASTIGDDEWMRPSTGISQASSHASNVSHTSQASVVNLELNP